MRRYGRTYVDMRGGMGGGMREGTYVGMGGGMQV